MADVCVCQQPGAHLVAVEPLEEELAEVRVWLDDVFEWDGVVYLLVVLDRVDLVVADETFDREAVVDVVFLVKSFGVGGGEGEVGLEELAYGWF